MPIRTCLVTKNKAEQSELLRFTIQNQKLVFDQNKKAQKRGGYVVPHSDVIGKLEKLSKKVAYFLREPTVYIDPEVIKAEIQKLTSSQAF